MDTCLLCLQEPSSFNSYVPINQQVLHMIEKHFWAINDLHNTLGVCFVCWTKLNEFHTFYEKVEEAHRIVTDFCNEKKFTYPNLETEMVQIPIHLVRKPNTTINEEPEIIVDEFEDDIKVENSFDECETICDPSITSEQIDYNPLSITSEQKDSFNLSITSEQIDSHAITIEKRKRGRPRKIHIKHEVLVKKPKGKRGRPRKVLSSYQNNNNKTATKIDLMQQLKTHNKPEVLVKKPKGKRGRPRKNVLSSYQNNNNKTATKQLNYTKELETLPQGVFNTTMRNGIPPKKKGRGRPRKIQNNENSQKIVEENELAVPDNILSVKESFNYQAEESINGQLLNLKETNVEMVNKNRKIISLMKKRKRIHQHKALMRNYIATSVRCMKFLKK